MKQQLRYLLFAALAAASTAIAADDKWVGKTLPTLKADDAKTGAKIDIKGKPAMVEFWATWCGPCKAGIPHLNELHTKFKDKGLVIVGVTDEDKKVVAKFREGTPMEYTVAIDKGGDLSQKLGITGIPHAVLVDKAGKIVWKGHPASLKEEEIEKLLK